jgi:lipoyl(octanoyl) transferase
VISVVQLGQLDYAEGLRLQQRLVDLRKAGDMGDLLLLLEHSPVITLGRNAKAAHVLASPEALAAHGVEVFECDRGGDVTFHGPGQIVGYPIFDLRAHELVPLDGELRSQRFADRSVQATGVRATSLRATSPRATPDRKTLGAVDYVRRLEEVLIRTCGDFEISTKRVVGLTGAWTETAPESKIAAIGVHISRSVTSHGFALNMNNDLSFFDLIVPCGITAKPVTSMRKELGREVDVDAVVQSLSRNFGAVFGRQMLWLDNIDTLLGNAVGTPMRPPSQLRQLHREDDIAQA